MYLKLHVVVSILMLLISLQTNTLIYSIFSLIITTLLTIYFLKNRLILNPVINTLIQEYTLSIILQKNIFGIAIFIAVNIFIILQLEYSLKQYYRTETFE